MRRPGLAGVLKKGSTGSSSQSSADPSDSAPTHNAPEVDDGTTSDTLFPSVAVSDAINAIAHAYAAWVVLPASLPACLGFALVAAAAAVGTARFGCSARLFRPGNEALAELAAFVGLPLVGSAAVLRNAGAYFSGVDPTAFAVSLAAVGAVVRGLPTSAAEAVRTVLVAATFIVPVVIDGVLRGDAVMAGCGLLFAAAGLAVRPERHTFLLGLRREDWFHAMIATASVGIALRLRAGVPFEAGGAPPLPVA